MMRQILAKLMSVGLLVVSPLNGLGQEEYIVRLSNGMILGPGQLSETDSLSTSSFQRGGGGETKSKSIGVMDDGLRLTYFYLAPKNFRAQPSNATPLEQVELPSANEVARSGNAPSIRQVLGVSKFNKYGRRTFSFVGPRGKTDVLQGITLLTPKFTKLEILNTEGTEFVWDTRKATNSIPPDQLNSILKQAIGMKTSGDWLRLVQFYIQAERYSEARDAMAEGLGKFPIELANKSAIVQKLDRLYTTQIFDEIELRKKSGQHLMAAKFLGTLPPKAIETQVTLEAELAKSTQELRQMGEVAKALEERVQQLPQPDQQLVAPLVQELLGEMSHNTFDRLADFNRLGSDESIPNENKVSLALSGWLLGNGGGLENFAVVKSLIRVRGLVTEYLRDAGPARRQQILTLLRSEEGARPELLAKLLEHMKPPVPLPNVREDDPPGMYRVATGGEQAVEYIVQLPPEYDPNRKYPCLLALPGRGDPPELEINVWCGLYAKLANVKARSGYATRYGYIVVSPKWMTEKQSDYEYTEAEQNRILRSMRDAMRKFNIDSDRIFITGHFAGATAAWDLASSHPDLWAGAVMVSPGADKFIVQYAQNLKGKSFETIPLGTYVVYGNLDGTRQTSKVGSVVTQYLSTFYDSVVVGYRGRGSGLFIDELPRIFEWMELSSRRRIRTPRSIDCKTMRNGDRFFYWLEAPSIVPAVAGNAYQFDPSSAGYFQANLLDSTINGLSVSKIPSPQRQANVWLTPGMVDFSRPITVSMSGRRRSYNLTPDVGIMLEDARTRADRQHVFWQKLMLK